MLIEYTEINNATILGFTIQPGFWFGTDTDGVLCVTSCMTCNGNVKMYEYNGNGNWIPNWYDFTSESGYRYVEKLFGESFAEALLKREIEMMYEGE